VSRRYNKAPSNWNFYKAYIKSWTIWNIGEIIEK
jgi:hypothetical protein